MKGEKKIIEIPLYDILPNRFQPRIKFNESAIEELAESIKEHGVIQPIVVRKIGDKYEIIAGERRYKASILASLKTIPAIITDLDDKESAEIALIENVQRQDLTPIEEAISYKKILDMGYLTQDLLANKLGRTQSTIANKIRLLNLDEEVQEALLDEKISERHARSLLKLDNIIDQKKLLKKIVDERLTVRKTDEEINKMLKEKENIEEDNEIEILDFDSIDMTNNEKISLSAFNIPTVPIIDDIIEKNIISNIEPISQIESKKDNGLQTEEKNNEEYYIEKDNIVVDETQKKEEQNINNPGFMDIEKIENEAKDIFVEKTTVNLEDLLTKDKNMVETAIEENQEEAVEDELLRPGKFFNIFFDDKEKNENDKEENSSIDSKNTFNFEKEFINDFEKENVEMDKNKIEEDIKDISNELKFDNLYEKSNEDFNLTEENILSETETREQNVNIEETSKNYENFHEEFIKEEQSDDYKDIKIAINMIRECAKNIEKYGFVVDTEEIDFENMYQVIFKIDK